MGQEALNQPTATDTPEARIDHCQLMHSTKR